MAKNIKTYIKKIKSLIFPLLILLAIFTRFWRLNQTAFFINDQGRDLMVLYDFVVNKRPVLLGPPTSFFSSFAGIYFGPHYYYFLLPFYLINRSPLFITSIIPILFMVNIWLFLKIKEINFLEKTIFLILIIFSALSIYYTTFLWNLNVAFLLSFLLFNLLFIFKKKIFESPWLGLVFGLAAGSVFQMHYGLLFLYIGFVYVIIKEKWPIIYYLLGFILSFLPFLIFNLRHDMVLVRAMFDGLRMFSKKTDIQSLPFTYVFIKMFDSYLSPNLKGWDIFKTIVTALIFMVTIYLLIRKRTLMSSFIALIYPIFLITFVFFKRNFDYYFACFFMWYFLGIALVLAQLIKKNRLLGVVITILLIVFSINNIVHYYKSINSVYAIDSQTKIAESIAKEVSGLGIKLINLNLRPNVLDKRGIEYVLLSKYNVATTPKENVSGFFVCFYDKCLRKGKKIKNIYHEDNINVYYLIPYPPKTQ